MSQSTVPKSCLGAMYLSDEGTIDGWCQYQENPEERATVELLVDGMALRAMRATRLRLDRRDIGMGDGYCGFSFPFPPAPDDDEDQLVLDVREKRYGTLIGRIVLGNKTAAMNRRLDAVETALATVGHRLAALPPQKSRAVEATGALGLTLLQLAGRPPAQRKLGLPGLQAAQAQIADIPAMDLPWHPSPDFSLIVRTDRNLRDLAKQMIAVASAVNGLSIEFLLLDDGKIPAAALLPTRLRHLTLVPVAHMDSLGQALNTAAASARGKFLVFGGSAGPGLALLRGTLQRAQCGQVAMAHGTVGQGAQCIVARDDFTALGGFEPNARDQSLWQGLIAKAQALQYQIVPLETARSVNARWV